MKMLILLKVNYGLKMNEKQIKQRDDFFWDKDVEGLKELLIKEKLYP